jgi:hypothetical protein
MADQKEMPKQTFAKKLKKGEKLPVQGDHLLAIR